jgi:hypothetical protein
MSQTYTYLLTDFTTSGGEVDVASLKAEIESSAITIALEFPEPITVGFSDAEITFKVPISGAEETILDDIVANHEAIPILLEDGFLRDAEGNVLTAPRISAGVDGRFVSHNFCDSCTWWQESLESLNTTTSDLGGLGLVFTLSLPQGTHLIDVRHGRLTDEDKIDETSVAPNGNTMTSIIPQVYINGNPIDQINEDASAGVNRYTIDYEAGTVTFAVAKILQTVTVDCRYPVGSLFRFKPPTGKKWTFTLAEIDLSADVDLSSMVDTALWGSNPDTPPDGSNGTLVPLGGRTYKRTKDLHAYANDFLGPLPASLGGTGQTGEEAWTFKWYYQRSTLMYNSLNALGPGKYTINEARIQTRDDLPLGGSYLTITYHSSEDSE